MISMWMVLNFQMYFLKKRKNNITKTKMVDWERITETEPVEKKRVVNQNLPKVDYIDSIIPHSREKTHVSKDTKMIHPIKYTLVFLHKWIDLNRNDWWLFTASAPRLSGVIIVPKDGYRSHKEQWIIEYNIR